MKHKITKSTKKSRQHQQQPASTSTSCSTMTTTTTTTTRRLTDRRELTPLQRAIAVMKSHHGVSHRAIAAEFTALHVPITQPGITKLVQRTEQRVRELGTSLLDERVYESMQGKRGRQVPVLSEGWKDVLEGVVVGNRRLRARQLLGEGGVGVLPVGFPAVSVSTVESALYERGYRRVKGAWKKPGKQQKQQQPQQQQQLDDQGGDKNDGDENNNDDDDDDDDDGAAAARLQNSGNPEDGLITHEKQSTTRPRYLGQDVQEEVGEALAPALPPMTTTSS